MFRNVLLALASLGFASAAMADCDASHAAKHEMTDDQAQVAQPAVKTAAAPAAKKKQVASSGNRSDKSKQASTPSKVALARDGTPQADKPTN